METTSTLTEDEVARFLEAARADRNYALYLLILRTDLRQGEILGLHWADVDLSGRRLYVRRQLIESPTRLCFGPLKTRQGERWIDLSPDAAEALAAHGKAQIARGWSACKLVFPDTIGGPMRALHLYRRSLRQVLMRAGLPAIPFHKLRSSRR